MFILQSGILIAIAFLVGCVIGTLLQRVLGGNGGSIDKAPARKSASAGNAPKAAAGQKDNLKKIRGVGPQNEEKLNAIGITSFAQIAAWSADEQRELGERLSFPGRIERENWVEQAAVLAGGGETEFATRVEKGEVDSSNG